MTIKCKHFQTDAEHQRFRCNILKNELYFKSTLNYYDSKIDACPFTKSIACKYYEPIEEEKYALFAETHIPNLYQATLYGEIEYCNGRTTMNANPIDRVSIRLTSDMTLDELTDKVGSLWMNGETSWLKNVVVRRIDDK
jgi:hypothetical protein